MKAFLLDVVRVSFLVMIYVNTTGFLFNKPNRIIEENRTTPSCAGDTVLKLPYSCYQRIVEAKLNEVYPYYERKNIKYTLSSSINSLEENINKTKKSFMALDKVSSGDNNSEFKSAMSSSFIVSDIIELKKSYDEVQSNIDAINEEKQKFDLLDKTKIALISRYSGVDPLFERAVDEGIRKIKDSGKQGISIFMDKQKPLMEESSQLIDRYNIFADNYNKIIDQDNEDIENFAIKNGMIGYENDFLKLLDGSEAANKYIDYLIYFSDSEPVYTAEPLASKSDKKIYKYVSRYNPVRIFVDYKDIHVYDTLYLRKKYFKLLKVEPFISVTGVAGYSLYLEYVKLK